eukprot:gene2142-2640_t
MEASEEYSISENQPLISSSQQQQQQPSKTPFRNTSIYNIVVLGLSFCVLFSAFSPTQNLETTLNVNLGFLSLSLLYASLALSNFISPLVILKLGEKYSLALGTLTYALYIAANIKVTAPTLCVAAVILGFGGAILWTAQGAFVIRCSTEKTLGFNTGLFFALFQVNQVIGNLGTGVLINKGMSEFTLFIILTGVCTSAVIGFLLLGNPVNPEKDKSNEVDLPLSERLLLTFNFIKNERPIQLLIVALLYSGISQSFFFGVFPPLSGKYYLGYIMAVFGTCDALGSVIMGKLSDIIGRKSLIIFSTLCCLGGSIFAYIIHTKIEENQIALYFICAGLLGLADAGFNTLMYALIGIIYPRKGESAVAVFKFVQSIASAIAFFYGKYAVLYQHVIILNSLVIPSCILFLIVDIKYAPKKQQFDSISSIQ